MKVGLQSFSLTCRERHGFYVVNFYAIAFFKDDVRAENEDTQRKKNFEAKHK